MLVWNTMTATKWTAAVAVAVLALFPRAGAAQSSNFGGPVTKDLAGASLIYQYSTGGAKFQLDFAADQFTMARPNDPKAKPQSLPYRARKIRNDLYLVHCFVRNPEGHTLVTLLLDFTQKQVNVSAITPGNIEWFDVGQIEKMQLPTSLRLR